MTPQILIVGAGPSGMVLALQLAHFGVPFRIIDKANERRTGSKALSINPATLFCLDAIGCADAIVALARPVRRATVSYRGKRFSVADFARLTTRYDAFYMLPQWQTEGVLEEALCRAGVVVERGCELVSIAHSQAGARVHTRTRNGSLRRADYRFVLACDGSHSRVRSALDIGFSGYDFGFDLLLADVMVQGLRLPEQAHYWVEDQNFLISLPLDDERHRVVVSTPRSEAGTPTLSEVCSAVARSSVGLQLSRVNWLSRARCSGQLASSNRQGQVFLLGDAVHSFSPIGGFGMNTAIGDAFNLGWKLAYVCQGLAPSALLDSYRAERLPLADQLSRSNDANTSLIARLGRHDPTLEQSFLPRMSNRPFLKRLPLMLSGLAQSYAARPAGAAPGEACIGWLSPEVSELAARHTLGHWLVVPEAQATDPEWSRLVTSLSRETRLPLRLAPSQRARRVSLVRPDLVVEYVCTSDCPVAEVTRLLRRTRTVVDAIPDGVAHGALES